MFIAYTLKATETRKFNKLLSNRNGPPAPQNGFTHHQHGRDAYKISLVWQQGSLGRLHSASVCSTNAVS